MLDPHPEPPTSGAAGRVDVFRLVRALGSETGDEFLAHDTLLNRPVVLRFLPEGPAERAAALAAARALARIAHPGLARVHRVHEGAGRPYVVTAFVRGEPLASAPRPLPDERVLEIGRSLASALAALHAAGVTHGDVCD